MAVIKVKNKKKEEVRVLESHDSWLDFHAEKNEYGVDFCVNEDCYGEAEVGVCVVEVSRAAKEYIAPLCKKCNCQSSNIHFKVDEDFLAMI